MARKKANTKKKIALERFRWWLKQVLQYKSSDYHQTSFNFVFSSVVEKLIKMGANPWQIGRFKQLVKKAPIGGVGRFKRYSGD